MKNILFVGLGGALGSVLRYLVSLLFVSLQISGSLSFPFATLSVNFVGSFLIGALAYFFSGSGIGFFFFAVTGFCGGFTTFSAFSLEAFAFLREGNYMLAAVYVFSSFFLCIAAVFAGYLLMKYASQAF